MKINWHIVPFEALNAKTLHDILKIRIDVFVVEQNCPYPELDGKDLKSYHVFGVNENDGIVAVARILPPNVSYPEVSIGRVATKKSERMTGLGHLLMEKCIEFIAQEFKTKTIRISAQKYLENFYFSHGFEPVGKEYLEDNIPHLEMIKTK